MAFQRARASNGSSTWVEELYGRRPGVITAAIARITYELMIEQQRQEEIAHKELGGGIFDPDVVLKMENPGLWKLMREVRVKF